MNRRVSITEGNIWGKMRWKKLKIATTHKTINHNGYFSFWCKMIWERLNSKHTSNVPIVKKQIALCFKKYLSAIVVKAMDGAVWNPAVPYVKFAASMVIVIVFLLGMNCFIAAVHVSSMFKSLFEDGWEHYLFLTNTVFRAISAWNNDPKVSFQRWNAWK